MEVSRWENCQVCPSLCMLQEDHHGWSDRLLGQGRTRYAPDPWRLSDSDAQGQFPRPTKQPCCPGQIRAEGNIVTIGLPCWRRTMQRAKEASGVFCRATGGQQHHWVARTAVSKPVRQDKGGLAGAEPAPKMQQPRRMQANLAGSALLAVRTPIPEQQGDGAATGSDGKMPEAPETSFNKPQQVSTSIIWFRGISRRWRSLTKATPVRASQTTTDETRGLDSAIAGHR